MMPGSTVIVRKQGFLRQQKLNLKEGIPRSNRLSQIAEEAGIKTNVLDDVLKKVNQDLKRHGREAYSLQMTEHVVEEIDMLYHEAAISALHAEDDVAPDTDTGSEDANAVYRSDDMALDKNIAKLPSTWDVSADAPSRTENGSKTVDQDAYINAVARLQSLSARRLTSQQKLNTYRTLLSLLEPYRTPQENIQPNLVGRDAPLAPELAKTRTLAIRVTGRIGEKYGDVLVPATSEEDSDAEMVEDDGNTKLQRILAGW